MQPCYLICGVSGSGKTWVCKQLTEKYIYIPHDEHMRDIAQVVKKMCRDAMRPIVTECPFGERVLRGAFETNGVKVIPYFVIERPEVVAKRYYDREGKTLPKSAETRASTIIERAIEWNAPWGTSTEILSKLKTLHNR